VEALFSYGLLGSRRRERFGSHDGLGMVAAELHHDAVDVSRNRGFGLPTGAIMEGRHDRWSRPRFKPEAGSFLARPARGA